MKTRKEFLVILGVLFIVVNIRLWKLIFTETVGEDLLCVQRQKFVKSGNVETCSHIFWFISELT